MSDVRATKRPRLEGPNLVAPVRRFILIRAADELHSEVIEGAVASKRYCKIREARHRMAWLHSFINPLPPKG